MGERLSNAKSGLIALCFKLRHQRLKRPYCGKQESNSQFSRPSSKQTVEMRLQSAEINKVLTLVEMYGIQENER